MPHLTKRIFLGANLCRRKGWLLRNRTGPADLSLGEQFRIDQGIEIGEKARELFPDGILIQEKVPEHAAQKTRELLADPSVHALFEATFLHNGYAAKADVLVRNGTAWDLIEVKSTTSKVREKKKELADLLDDMAYTAAVIGKNGLPVANARLMLLSETFQLGMSREKLFEQFEYTKEVRARAAEFETLFSPYAAAVSQPEPPEFRLTGACKQCEFFDQCMPKGEEYSIFNIPRLSEKQMLDLHGKGIFRVRDIPASYRFTDTQAGPVACMRSGDLIISPKLKQELSKVRWPAHYLDFETTQTAYPLYENVTPYEKIATQYSIHTCSRCGDVLCHKEYLADPARDCRRELAEQLIRDLDGSGSVLCYSSFEKQVIGGLIQRYPDLREPLTTILGRLVDLIECTKCVNHPAFRGSNSIKVVLPALVPEMSYEGLPIANGEDALVTFALMARASRRAVGPEGREERISVLRRFSPEECAKKREEMLRYCEQDTLAMVKIHEVFEKMAGGCFTGIH